MLESEPRVLLDEKLEVAGWIVQYIKAFIPIIIQTPL